MPYPGFLFLVTCAAQKTRGKTLERYGVMAKSKKKLEILHLVCEETGDYNYTIRRKSGGEKLKLKKYCPRLRKHTVHVEKKK